MKPLRLVVGTLRGPDSARPFVVRKARLARGPDLALRGRLVLSGRNEVLLIRASEVVAAAGVPVA